MTTRPQTHMDSALRASEAFHQLHPHEQDALRRDLNHVMGVITDERPAVALKEAGDPTPLGNRITGNPTNQSAAAMRRLKDSIGFGDFVKELISNVYDAIVNSSMDQMRAYSKMLEEVMQPVNDFASTKINDTQAHDFLQQMFPKSLSLGGDGKLALQPGKSMPDMSKQFPGLGTIDFNSPQSSTALTQAAKLKMARQRQQLLATMVMMPMSE